MKHFEITILDFRQYTPITVEVIGGSRPRMVLGKGNNNLKHFLKSYSHNSREIAAEFIASKLGSLADFKVQKTTIKILPPNLMQFFQEKYSQFLPKDWKPIGALVKNIFPRGYEVRYGFTIVKKNPTDKLKLSEIEQSIRSKYYAPDDLLQSLAEMIVFDAWIGNMDRHHENWGILEHNTVNFLQTTLVPKSLIKKGDLLIYLTTEAVCFLS